MELSLEFLQVALSSRIPTTLANARSEQRFHGIRILRPDTKPRQGLLYLCENGLNTIGDLQVEAFEGAGLVAPCSSADMPADIPIILFDGIESGTAFDLVCGVFDFFESWSRRVYEQALAMPKLDSLASLLNEVTPNPWYIADSSYRVLAARSAPDVEDLSYIWRFLYRNRRLPLETILAMEDTGKIEEMSRRKRAYIPTTTPFNIPFVSKSVASPGGVIVHFHIIGVYTQLSQYEIEIADFFGDVLNRVVAGEGGVLAGAARFYDSFLSDLAIGVVSDDSKSILQKMYDDFSWKPTDCLQLAVFGGRDKDGAASGAQKLSVLESRCDARGFYRDGCMVAVINLSRSKTGASIDDEACVRLVRPFARDMRCDVGLSERFSGFGGMLKMANWYEQARFAASVGKQAFEETGRGREGSPAVRTFSSVAMQYFRIRVVRTERLGPFRHPSLDVLLDYDQSNGTSLFETLRAYLENDRNTATTSEILFVHRNTLLKRLRKIVALTSLDLEDPECRKRLRASFATR